MVMHLLHITLWYSDMREHQVYNQCTCPLGNQVTTWFLDQHTLTKDQSPELTWKILFSPFCLMYSLGRNSFKLEREMLDPELFNWLTNQTSLHIKIVSMCKSNFSK